MFLRFKNISFFDGCWYILGNAPYVGSSICRNVYCTEKYANISATDLFLCGQRAMGKDDIKALGA